MTIADLADGPACYGMAHREARTVGEWNKHYGAGLGPGLVGPERTCPLSHARILAPTHKGRLLHRPVCEVRGYYCRRILSTTSAKGGSEGGNASISAARAGAGGRALELPGGAVYRAGLAVI